MYLLLFLYYEPTNAHLFHNFSHCYMFRHYRVNLRQLVINTLPSYTSISSAAVGNTVYKCDVSQRFFCFVLWTNKCTIISQVTRLLHVSTLSYHPQGACKRNKTHVKFQQHNTYVKHLNCNLCYQQLHLKYLCNLARYWLQAVWGWHNNVETCSRSVIICEIIVYLLVHRAK